jgi:uncharacterized protein (TIRG00374 family)
MTSNPPKSPSPILRVLSTPAFRIGVGVLISVIALYLSIRNVDVRVVGSTLARADILFVILTVASVAVNTLSKAIRWHILIGPTGNAIPFRKIFALLLVGQMINNLLPLRAGDVTRAYIVGGMGPGRVFVLGTVVLEKFLDMLSYATLFFVLIILIPLPHWISDSLLTFSLVVAIMGIGVVVLVRQREWFLALLEHGIVRLPPHIQEMTRRRVRSAISSLNILEHSKDRLWLVLWSSIIWGTAVLNNYLVLQALHIDVTAPMVASLLVLIVLQLGISLPSAPGTIGVFEYGCVLALSLFGVGESMAFSYGVLLHIIVLLPIMIGGVLFWTMGVSQQQGDIVASSASASASVSEK